MADISSMVVVDREDKQYSELYLAAARATALSPSWWNILLPTARHVTLRDTCLKLGHLRWDT